MPDERGPSRRSGVRIAVATGAAGLALVAGTVLLLVLFCVILVKLGFGVMLLVATGALLLFGAVYDLRRKRRRSPEDDPPP